MKSKYVANYSLAVRRQRRQRERGRGKGKRNTELDFRPEKK